MALNFSFPSFAFHNSVIKLLSSVVHLLLKRRMFQLDVFVLNAISYEILTVVYSFFTCCFYYEQIIYERNYLIFALNFETIRYL